MASVLAVMPQHLRSAPNVEPATVGRQSQPSTRLVASVALAAFFDTSKLSHRLTRSCSLLFDRHRQIAELDARRKIGSWATSFPVVRLSMEFAMNRPQSPQCEACCLWSRSSSFATPSGSSVSRAALGFKHAWATQVGSDYCSALHRAVCDPDDVLRFMGDTPKVVHRGLGENTRPA